MRFAVASMSSLFLLAACADLFGGHSAQTQGQNAEVLGDELEPVGEGCTLTQGYWKNHEEDWPVDELEIGGVTYSKAELLELYRTPPRGDASLILEHQLATAKLNVAAGATPPGDLIEQGDAWMAANADADGRLPFDSGADEDAVRISGELDAYNNGETGPGHCDDGPPAGDTDSDSDSDSDSDADGDSDGDSDTDSDSDEGDCPAGTEGCEPGTPSEGDGEGEAVGEGEGEGEGEEGCFLPGTEIPCAG